VLRDSTIWPVAFSLLTKLSAENQTSIIMEELVFKSEKGATVTSSSLVAQKFGKQHKDVLEAVRRLAENSADVPSIGVMFCEASLPDAYGRMQPVFIMNRDGFSLLVMGFTGKDALKFKVDFIEAFNIMEQQLKEAQKPLSTLDLLELAVKGMRENQQALEEVKRDVRELQARTETRPSYFTVVGYGALHHIPVNLKQAAAIGLGAKQARFVKSAALK
jgi:Rha family phage regulatory protein